MNDIALLLYITSILVFSFSLLDIVKIIKSVFSAYNTLQELKKDPKKKEIQMNISFYVMFRLFMNFVIVSLLILSWFKINL